MAPDIQVCIVWLACAPVTTVICGLRFLFERTAFLKALWLQNNKLGLRAIEAPGFVRPEALVRVLLAGVCNTDLELLHGYYPFTGVPGHEFVGVVEEGPSELVGKRVVGEINVVCHDCDACRNDRTSHCENRTVLGIKNRNGAFAEYTTLPAENLHAVPDSVPDRAAVFTEPLAAALQARHQVELAPSDRVAVIGDGKLGNLVAQVFSLTGCDLIALGRHEQKLQRLTSRGVRTTTDPTDLRAMDLVVECTGNPDGFAVAAASTRPGGTIVLKSTYRGDLTFNASVLVVNEITVVGSRCGPFGPALELLEKGRVDVESLVDDVFSLENGVGAFARAAEKGVMKVLIRP